MSLLRNSCRKLSRHPPAKLIGDKAYDPHKLNSSTSIYATNTASRDRTQPPPPRQNAEPAETPPLQETLEGPNDSLPGRTTSAGSSRDGTSTSKTSSTLFNSPALTFNSPALTSRSDVHENVSSSITTGWKQKPTCYVKNGARIAFRIP